jgi:hypothetical protein
MTIPKTDLALLLAVLSVLQGFGFSVLAIAFIGIFLLGRLTA